jgi:hypothetical protein
MVSDDAAAFLSDEAAKALELLGQLMEAPSDSNGPLAPHLLKDARVIHA